MTRFGQSLLFSSSVKKKTKGGSARRVTGMYLKETTFCGLVLNFTIIGLRKCKTEYILMWLNTSIYFNFYTFSLSYIYDGSDIAIIA